MKATCILMCAMALVLDAGLASARTHAPATPNGAAKAITLEAQVNPGVGAPKYLTPTPLDTSTIPLASTDQYNLFAVGVDTSLIGSEVSSGTFGVGNFSGGIAFHLGSNTIGKALNASIGLAKWESPAPSSIYPATVLSLAQLTQTAAELSALTVGIGFSYGERNLGRIQAEGVGKDLDTIDDEMKGNDPAYKNQPASYWQMRYWRDYWRDRLKKPELSGGVILKAKSVDSQSEVDSGIVYLSFADGGGPFDWVLNGQFIAASATDDIEDKGYKGTLTWLIDMDDSPPPGQLCLSVTGGYYTYKSQSLGLGGPSASPDAIEISPQVSVRLSSLVNYVGGGEFGLRYSKLVPSATGVPEENKFVFFISQNILDQVNAKNGSQ